MSQFVTSNLFHKTQYIIPLFGYFLITALYCQAGWLHLLYNSLMTPG